MHRYVSMILLMGILLLGGVLTAQDATEDPTPIAVPDVVGLTIPEAAAALNAAGFNLGEEIIQPPEGGEVPTQSEIVAQSVEPGTTAEPGSAVDVTVIRTNNMLLIYDDNDITMVNQSGARLDLTTVTFSSENTRFNANRWGNTALDAADCTQLWSVGRGSPKSVDECGAIQRWLTTNDRNEHFWTAANTTGTFTVVQAGVVRADCPTATTPGEIVSCELFMATGGTTEVTEFLYLAYTSDALLVHNISDALWMPLDGITIISNRGTSTPLVVSATRFDETITVGQVSRLAPGQCIYYTSASAAGADTLEDCTELGRITLGTDGPFFWDVGFDIEGVTGQPTATCPPAVEGRLTLCIVPR